MEYANFSWSGKAYRNVDLSRDQKEEGEVCQPKEVTVSGQQIQKRGWERAGSGLGALQSQASGDRSQLSEGKSDGR